MSTDGVNWTKYENGNQWWRSVLWDGARFLALSGGLSIGVFASADGVLWERIDDGSVPAYTEKIIFTGLGYLGLPGLAASRDGIRWDRVALPVRGMPAAAAWNGRTLVVAGDASSCKWNVGARALADPITKLY